MGIERAVSDIHRPIARGRDSTVRLVWMDAKAESKTSYEASSFRLLGPPSARMHSLEDFTGRFTKGTQGSEQQAKPLWR